MINNRLFSSILLTSESPWSYLKNNQIHNDTLSGLGLADLTHLIMTTGFSVCVIMVIVAACKIMWGNAGGKEEGKNIVKNKLIVACFLGASIAMLSLMFSISKKLAGIS